VKIEGGGRPGKKGEKKGGGRPLKGLYIVASLFIPQTRKGTPRRAEKGRSPRTRIGHHKGRGEGSLTRRCAVVCQNFRDREGKKGGGREGFYPWSKKKKGGGRRVIHAYHISEYPPEGEKKRKKERRLQRPNPFKKKRVMERESMRISRTGLVRQKRRKKKGIS